MANPEHVAKLKEGREAWNAGRKTTDETPDLSGVKLVGDSLNDYDLRSANFSGAELRHVSFQDTLCDDCSFERTMFDQAIFDSAVLRRSNFRKSIVVFTLFEWCNLDEA